MKKIIRQRLDNGIRIDFQPVERVVSLRDANGQILTRKGFDEWDLVFPTRLVLEIESRCNSGCKYCSYQGKKHGPRLSKELIFKAIDEAEAMKVLEISLRGGEATLHPDFEAIWQYAESKEFTSVNLITNGLLLNKERAEALLKKPTSKLIISLDGFPETNANRNPHQYATVMSWLPEIIPDHQHQIVILTCLYRESAEESLKFSRHLAEMGLLYHNFPVLKRQGRAHAFKSGDFLSCHEMIELQRKLNEMKGEFPGFRPIISCGEVHAKSYAKMESIPVPLFNDLYMSQTARVITSGEVKVMTGGHFDEEFSRQIEEKDDLGPLGNIADDTLPNIWLRQKGVRRKQVEIGYRYYPYFLGWKNSLSDC